MSTEQNILSVDIRYENDVVAARQRARQLAACLGFDLQDQTRIATAVSEMARNAYQYAGGGAVQFQVRGRVPQMFVIVVNDNGKGIANLNQILLGRYRSETGMGIGIVGAKRLMDRFEIESSPAKGTVVLLGKVLPKSTGPLGPRDIQAIADKIARAGALDPLQELQQQNKELLRALEDLRARTAELAEVNAELEDTNRGVVALYAELDDRADYLQRASELKSRFLSNMSHEFRTPLNSILSLSRLLLDRVDGELSPEQEKQVNYIRRSAQDLTDLVNDLLDLAKVEAGKINVKPAPFELTTLFSALRGMLRPLLLQRNLELTIDEPQNVPTLVTDEGKVSQVLRNLLSNALKYTENGEVHLTATAGPADTVLFAVRDTGIGIAEEDKPRIFDEWVQIDNPLQKRQKGTGLGLPLSKKLAELLGGSLWMESELGVGSTFYFSIPATYGVARDMAADLLAQPDLDPTRLPILVVEDNLETMFVYEKYLKGSPYQVLPARTVRQARESIQHTRPAAIILDILLEHENTWDFLREIKNSPELREVPVLVATVVDNQNKALSLGADMFVIKPIEREWLVHNLRGLVEARKKEKLLVIDDDEVSRYLMRGLVAQTRYRMIEAENGEEGLRKALAEDPDVILLDIIMPDIVGFEVLRALKADARTAAIPVIVYTSKQLSEAERKELAPAVAILSKTTGSRETALADFRQALAAASSPSAIARNAT